MKKKDEQANAIADEMEDLPDHELPKDGLPPMKKVEPDPDDEDPDKNKVDKYEEVIDKLDEYEEGLEKRDPDVPQYEE